MTPAILAAIEPERWVLVFQRSSAVWWVRALARGRYKHVAAYAYLPGLRHWLIFDWNMQGIATVVVPDDDEGLGWLYELTKDADLMAVQRQPRDAPRARFRLGYCVPAIAHLIGLNGPLFRPDALWEACLRAGGQPLAKPATVPAAAA